MREFAVYAGSFEPPTLGHQWMIEQGARGSSSAWLSPWA